MRLNDSRRQHFLSRPTHPNNRLGVAFSLKEVMGERFTRGIVLVEGTLSQILHHSR